MSKCKEPTDGKIAWIEKVLRADILWIVKYGPGWDPHTGARKNGVWHINDKDTKPCGGCAIAAHCIRWQPRYKSTLRLNNNNKKATDVIATAIDFHVKYNWLIAVYRLIATTPDNWLSSEEHNFKSNNPKAAALAKRLRKYGDSLEEEKDLLRHEAGEEMQLFAEKYILKNTGKNFNRVFGA